MQHSLRPLSLKNNITTKKALFPEQSLIPPEPYKSSPETQGPRDGVPALILAPMEGVTDAPMRAVQTSLGAFSYCVSEFLRVSHEVIPRKVFLRHVPELRSGSVTGTGVPVHVQILGGDAARMARSAIVACDLGAKAIDINFGCPAPTVNRHDGGATLLKYPHRVEQIVAAVRESVPPTIPVSAKLRLGWDTLDAIHENARRAENGGASWVTIHGRTRDAGYRPPAYWEPIGEVKRNLRIPVIANGDIWNLEDFRKCRKQSGCEHFMLGRGALADPNLSLAIAAELGIPLAAPAPKARIGLLPQDWLPILREFVAVANAMAFSSFHTARRIKQWVKMSSLRVELPWFDAIKSLNTCEEIIALLEDESYSLQTL